MIKTLKKLLALVILSTTTVSCSLAFLNDEDAELDGNLKIVINGVVSDVVTNASLEDILVTFSAFAENSPSVMPLISKTAYTDSNGIYRIEVSGFSDAITCVLTAESTDRSEMHYQLQENKIVVTWSGNTYDSTNRIFYVNDCNFQMKKD